MNRDNRQAGKDIERRRIERALAGSKRCQPLPGGRCALGPGVFAALSFLALHADEHWPFEQFQNALADPGMDGPKPEARWQMLNASLNGIKRVVRR